MNHFNFIEKMNTSMWWDSCGGTLNMSLGYIERDHDCYKDRKIVKVFF